MILRKMSGQLLTYMGLNKLMDTIAAYFYASQFPIFSRLDQSLFLGLARSIVTSYLNVSKEKNFLPQETNGQLARNGQVTTRKISRTGGDVISARHGIIYQDVLH